MSGPVTRSGALVLVALAAWIAVIVALMMHARRWALGEMATPAAQSQWQEWREAVAENNRESGPVRRRVPKSTEPPVVVLMRDYFAVCMSGAVFFGALILLVTFALVRGALDREPKPPN